MRIVYKYTLSPVTLGNEYFSISTPPGFKPLTLQIQGGDVCLWAEVDALAPVYETHTFKVIGTGHPVPEKGVYVGTWQESRFVWHLYEIK